MTPTEIQEMVQQIARLTPGVAQSTVVKHMCALFPVTARQITMEIKRSLPLRPYKQSNGRIQLWLLKPGSFTEHYGTPTGAARKPQYTKQH